jgi:DNA integrity scanning protein DisA with diadenylate cyclase activity
VKGVTEAGSKSRIVGLDHHRNRILIAKIFAELAVINLKRRVTGHKVVTTGQKFHVLYRVEQTQNSEYQ